MKKEAKILKLKKNLATLGAVMMLASLAACSSDNDPAKETESGSNSNTIRLHTQGIVCSA